MNTVPSERYRAALNTLFASLEEQSDLGKDGQKTVALDQQAVGRLSRMDAMQHQAMAIAQQARREQLKARIIAALARLDEGEFGYCIECGEEIAAKRLEFDPSIATCVSCARG